LDLALDFARAGFYREAIELLRGAVPEPASGTAPLVQYYQADFLYRAGDEAAAKSARVAAKLAPPDYCFPARLEEIAILQSAIDADSNDARARYYLGNLFYDRRRHGEAIQRWEASAKIDPTFSIVWRNLGIGFVNISKNLEAARVAYDKALAANPSDARLLYERDQLRKKMRESPANRLMELEKLAALAQKRDDLTVELCALYNQTGRPREALKLLESRRFQPWEGGEGQALGQYSRAHVLLGRLAMKNRDAGTARKHFESALAAPENLAEAKHLLANQSDIHFWIATACEALGDRPAAERHWNIAAESSGDFQEMSVRAFSGKTYYSALSLAALGQNDRAKKLLADLLMFAKDLATKPSKVDYFATSLPDMLLFEDDLNQRQKIESKFLSAQANLGLGDLAAGQSLLREVLEVNPSHALAADLLTGDFQPCAT
jgi:tetratricopeptide (TPR) repeat protein